MYILDEWNKSVLAVLSISLMGLGHNANAAVVLVNEFRNISANISVNTPVSSDSISTSRRSLGDFIDFDELKELALTLEDASVNSTAKQISQISTTSISAFGMSNSSAVITAIDPKFSTNSNAYAFANSNLSVSFEVATPQLFDLVGAVSSSNFSGFTSGRAEVSLNSQDGSFNLSIRTPFSEEQTIPFDLSGILFPNPILYRPMPTMMPMFLV